MLDEMTGMQAYRADLELHPQLEEVDDGPTTLWLLVDHCLSRLARCRPEDRRAYLEQSVWTFGERAEETRGEPSAVPALAPELSDQFVAVLHGGDPDDLFASCLAIASQASSAGAWFTAFHMLEALQGSFPGASRRLHARALHEQAGIATRLGDAEVAACLKRDAEIIARL